MFIHVYNVNIKQEILPKFSSQASVPLSHQPPLKKILDLRLHNVIRNFNQSFQTLISKKEMTSEHTHKKKSGALTASFDKEKKKINLIVKNKNNINPSP